MDFATISQWLGHASLNTTMRYARADLDLMHGEKDKLLGLIANIRAALSYVKAVAEQLPQADRWKTFLDYVVAKITRPLPPWSAPGQFIMQA